MGHLLFVDMRISFGSLLSLNWFAVDSDFMLPGIKKTLNMYSARFCKVLFGLRFAIDL